MEARQRAGRRDAAVVVGIPAAFALVALVLGLAAPSSAAGPVVPLATVQEEPGLVQQIKRGHSDGGPSGPSEAMAGLPPPSRGGADVPVTSRVDVDDPVFFVTIDDGTWKTQDTLRLVERERVPVTVFLTASAISDDAEYFRRITRFGGSVQNHTDHHEFLNRDGVDVAEEICGIQRRYERLFGTRPWMLRPPGGFAANAPTVQAAAASCGIEHVVMWDVVATDDEIQYVRPPLRRGDIVLLHFTPDLARTLERVLAVGRQHGLRPAPLGDYLARAGDTGTSALR